MDDNTKILIDNFISFTVKELQNDKHLKHVQFEKWSLDNFKITIKYFYETKEGRVYVDVRELKENPNHFLHLSGNLRDQLLSELNL
jgi:hypothetical protein